MQFRLSPFVYVQTSYTYEPFGNTSVTGTSNANEFQYTGRENEGNGLYYYRARYYSPLLGRFISEDPLGFASGDFNFYLYVGDDPVNDSDPLGLTHYKCHLFGGCEKISPSDRRKPPEPEDSDSESTRGQMSLPKTPWVLSWVLPVGPVPGIMGLGPAGDIEYNPATGNICVGLGVGASAGHTASLGPLVVGGSYTNKPWPQNADDILSGVSVSAGGNLPWPSPVAGVGGQVMANGSGWAAGPTIGVVGLSGQVTDSACTGPIW